MRVVRASLDLEVLVGAPVVDDDRQRAAVLGPEQRDLEAVADPVVQLPLSGSNVSMHSECHARMCAG